MSFFRIYPNVNAVNLELALNFDNGLTFTLVPIQGMGMSVTKTQQEQDVTTITPYSTRQ